MSKCGKVTTEDCASTNIHPAWRIFNPRSVAVVGASASPDKVGYMCVGNLLEMGFKGRVYPVNPGLAQLFGLKAYPSVSAIPGEVDLAMVVIPAELTPTTVEECAAKGVNWSTRATPWALPPSCPRGPPQS